MVFLGDLGRDLSEQERNYWLSFNIPPQGRGMSKTTFQRSFMGNFAEPSQPDLAFKQAYSEFYSMYREVHGWDFFLPLHADDEHFLTALHVLSKDNQSDFDSQLLALTKILIDSLNEKQISKGLTTIEPNDKGITKLEKFFLARGLVGFNDHIQFLRSLQNLRSTSAAHRKGSTYDALVRELRIKDEGQKIVFDRLLTDGRQLIEFLQTHLCMESTATPVEKPAVISKEEEVPKSTEA
jgi:hypothetical protein